MYERLRANIILNGERTQCISTDIRSKTRESMLPTPIQYSAWGCNQSSKTREGSKRVTNRKEEAKGPADGIVLYIRDSAKNLDMVHTFSKAAGYKISILNQQLCWHREISSWPYIHVHCNITDRSHWAMKRGHGREAWGGVWGGIEGDCGLV